MLPSEPAGQLVQGVPRLKSQLTLEREVTSRALFYLATGVRASRGGGTGEGRDILACCLPPSPPPAQQPGAWLLGQS